MPVNPSRRDASPYSLGLLLTQLNPFWLVPQILENLRFDDPLFNMATVLIAGIIGGELFALIRLPKVTGWIATGILLRWLLLPGMDTQADPTILNKFNPFMSFVLGFIAFTVGATLYFSSLRNTGKRIGLLLLCEALITPVIVGVLLFYVGRWLPGEMTRESAILLAAIAVAGAPGTTVLVLQESRARGILTRTLVAAIGLIDMVAIAVFVFVSTIIGDEIGWMHSLGSVAIQFVTTFLDWQSVGSAGAVVDADDCQPCFSGSDDGCRDSRFMGACFGVWNIGWNSCVYVCGHCGYEFAA